MENKINKTVQKYTNKPMSDTGITLIALIITIIILLILATLTLNMVMGEDGIFTRANTAKEKMEYSTAYEEINMKILEAQTEKHGKATLADVVEQLKEDPQYEYIVNYNSRSASLSNKGEITKVEDITKEVKEIYVIHKGYEFKIGDNLEITFVENKEIVLKDILKKSGISEDYTEQDIIDNKDGVLEKLLSSEIGFKYIINNSEKYLETIKKVTNLKTATFEAYIDGDNVHSFSLNPGKYIIIISGNTSFNITNFLVDDNTVESLGDNVYLCTVNNSVTINWYCNHYGVHKYLYVQYKSL